MLFLSLQVLSFIVLAFLFDCLSLPPLSCPLISLSSPFISSSCPMYCLSSPLHFPVISLSCSFISFRAPCISHTLLSFPFISRPLHFPSLPTHFPAYPFLIPLFPCVSLPFLYHFLFSFASYPFRSCFIRLKSLRSFYFLSLLFISRHCPVTSLEFPFPFTSFPCISAFTCPNLPFISLHFNVDFPLRFPFVSSSFHLFSPSFLLMPFHSLHFV